MSEGKPTPLPPGQYEISSFPRFGAPPFDKRFPGDTETIRLQVVGDVQQSVTVEHEWEHLPRVQQVSDFHCVTTWTRRALIWEGVSFADFYQYLVVPLAAPHPDAVFVVLRGQDGYRSSLPLADMLAADVLLADRLEGKPLSVAHGAPVRLVAPAHYGYKNVKHVSRIAFWRDATGYRPVGYRFMAHPRARVAEEERGQGAPGWLLRYLYRPLVRPVARRFERALQQHASLPDSDE